MGGVGEEGASRPMYAHFASGQTDMTRDEEGRGAGMRQNLSQRVLRKGETRVFATQVLNFGEMRERSRKSVKMRGRGGGHFRLDAWMDGMGRGRISQKKCAKNITQPNWQKMPQYCVHCHPKKK